MNDFEPLLVTADLSSPIILSEPDLALDGLLLKLALDEGGKKSVYEQVYYFWPLPVEYVTFPELPPRQDGGKEYVWCCSSAIADWSQSNTSLEYWTKRFRDDLYLDYGYETFNRRKGVGRWRDWQMPMIAWNISSISWVIKANAEKINNMIERCYSLGKKRSQGYGMVREWKILPLSRDYSIIGKGGRLMRPIPVMLDCLDKKTAKQTVRAWRPPYWDISMQRECWMPAEPLGIHVLEEVQDG